MAIPTISGSDPAELDTLINGVVSAANSEISDLATDISTGDSAITAVRQIRTYRVADATARAAISTPQEGSIADQLDTNTIWRYSGSAWQEYILGTPPRCRLLKNGSQNTSGTPGTATAITFALEDYDTASMHSTSSNTSRITVPTGGAGYYAITGRARLNSASVRLNIQIYKNGVAIPEASSYDVGNGSDAPYPEVNEVLYLADGDYIELFGASSAASTAYIVANCMFSANFLGTR